jgi:hypothetical protein
MNDLRTTAEAADVFTVPNAWAMAESLRLDLNSLGPFRTTP